MKIVKSLVSNNKKTIKYLQKTKDNHVIETGYYNLDEHVICISSQIGCLMNCIFCSTTAPIDSLNEKYFIRNLTSNEIIQQVKNILHLIKQKKSKRILFSYMGMGEPFLNYKNVVKSIKPELMKELAHQKINTVLKLHLSLHAPNDALRKKILPKAQKIKLALEALKYFSLTKNTLSKVNYILIKNINDSKNHAIQLAKLLRSYPFIVKLSNLNDFNNLKSSSIDKFDMFEKTLNTYGIKTCRFFSTGTDIQAGCGQLRRHFYD